MDNSQAMLRRLRVWQCVKVLLIFIGIFLIQMLSSMVCTVIYIAAYIGREGMEKYLSSVSEMPLKIASDTDFLLSVSALSAFAALIWCGILYYRSTWRVEKNDYRAVFSTKNVLGIVAVGAGGCVFLSVLVTLISYLIPSAFESYSELMGNLTDGNPVLTYLYVLLIGPVSEELIFRGAMLDRFRTAFPLWLAVILQAFLFGVYHMNLIQGTYAFGLGALLGLICYKTGSIFASILTHCIFNATSYALSAVESEVILMLLFVISIAAFTAGVYYFVRVGGPNREEA